MTLLIPGGTAPGPGYFPLVEDLPGVVVGDRAEGSLAESAKRLAALLDGRPHLVVGHSFGGPRAVQLALDFPELVAGLVLVDPTPFNQPSVTRSLGPVTGAVALVSRVAPRLIAKGARRNLDKQVRAFGADPALVARGTEWVDDPIEPVRLAAALKHFGVEGTALAARLRANPLQLPGVVLSADRKAGSRITAAHVELAQLLGLEHEQWPRTGHVIQLQEPARLRDLVLSLERSLAAH